MSTSYYITCPETQKMLWIGQGFGGCETLYYGDEETMDLFNRFLNYHEGKNLVFTSEHDSKILDYAEFEPIPDFRKIYPNACQFLPNRYVNIPFEWVSIVDKLFGFIEEYFNSNELDSLVISNIIIEGNSIDLKLNRKDEYILNAVRLANSRIAKLGN